MLGIGDAPIDLTSPVSISEQDDDERRLYLSLESSNQTLLLENESGGQNIISSG